MATSDKKYKLRGNDPYKELACSAIRQAVMDYTVLAKGKTPEWLRKRVTTREREMEKIEEFFYSEDFLLYTDMDGPAILRKVKEEIGCEMKKKVV